jgi:hypothetical protein
MLRTGGSTCLEALLNGFFIALNKLVVTQWQRARVLKVREEQERLEGTKARRAEDSL